MLFDTGYVKHRSNGPVIFPVLGMPIAPLPCIASIGYQSAQHVLSIRRYYRFVLTGLQTAQPDLFPIKALAYSA
jgi:hypothetical protein